MELVDGSTTYEGGANPIDACFLRKKGECVDTESEYCNSGGDFMCPSGFTLTSGTQDHTFNDCLACTAGNYCNDGDTTTCPSGYQCPAYSYEANSYPAQPGDYIASNTENTAATGTYAPGASGTATNCPAGFEMTFSTTATDNFSALACTPEAAGTSCSAGKYCPEAADDDPISCHPGTFNAGTSGTDQDSCSDCTAGK